MILQVIDRPSRTVQNSHLDPTQRIYPACCRQLPDSRKSDSAASQVEVCDGTRRQIRQRLDGRVHVVFSRARPCKVKHLQAVSPLHESVKKTAGACSKVYECLCCWASLHVHTCTATNSDTTTHRHRHTYRHRNIHTHTVSL